MNLFLKKVNICILFLLFTAGKGLCQKQYQVLNIAFYNLENFFDTVHQAGKNDYDFLPGGAKEYNGKIYWDKVHRLATVLHDIGLDKSPDGPAVIGVAEIENENVLKDLINDSLLRERHYQIVHYESPDARGIDVALLYNPKYFQLDTSFPSTVHLPVGAHNGSYHTRDVLCAKGKLQGEEYFFFVNHWPSRLGGEAASAPDRAIAAGVTRHLMDSIFNININANMVSMGDLNDNPDNKSLTEVMKANGKIEDKDQLTLYNPWLELFNKGIGTLAYQDAWALFDQIVFSRHLLDRSEPTKKFFYYKASIFKREDMITKEGRYKGYPKRTFDFDRYNYGFSDHFPTYVTLIKQL